VNAFGCDEIVLPASIAGPKACSVRGLIIGRFFVRARFQNEEHVDTSGKDIAPRDWVVMHLPSMLCWSFADLSTALGVADDLSRWARVDPTSRSGYESKLRRQIGARLYDWCEAIYAGKMPFVPYRQWLEQSS
jgi:hypothetical protein